METMFNDAYRGKKVLVTGCAGLKGSWLCLWLKRLGAEVIGFGHIPSGLSHHELVGGDWPHIQDTLCMDDMCGSEPDLIFHLASKTVVNLSFKYPREYFENNIMSAVNILDAARNCPSVKGIVMVTTDKVYFDKQWEWGYRENDELGGDNPYSASKVCVEHIINSYRKCFNMNIATARAGNVVCGGDFTVDRLIPDIVKATSKGEKVMIHTPYSTRPFQFVLEALSGYLLLGQHILEGRFAVSDPLFQKGGNVNEAFNFGPDGEAISVMDIVRIAKEVWPAVEYEIDNAPTHPFTIYRLRLDSTKAKMVLGWKPRWTMEEAVRRAIEWYREFYKSGQIRTNQDIDDYEEAMRCV
jgi:CDP-glucose 4,6-dehydratase